jgi:hypothetical protein
MNGISYGECRNENVSVVAYSERAVSDVEGNQIDTTYAKKSDFGSSESDDSGSALTGIIYPEAGSHNSYYRGKDITKKFESGELYTKIADGTFDDLFIGDFFTATINGQSITCRLAGFNVYYHKGNTDFATNHAIIVPDEAIMTAAMNSSDDTSKGYNGSTMKTTTMATISGYLKDTFGDHLLTCKEYLSSTITTGTTSGAGGATGCATGGTWADSIADLMTEIEVFGSRNVSSGGFDELTGHLPLPLFVLNPMLVNLKKSIYWLRCTASSTQYAIVNSLGNVDIANASKEYDVRPRWVIG